MNAMDLDGAAPLTAAELSIGVSTAAAVTAEARAEANAKRASIAAARLPAVAEEDLDEDAAVALLIQPRQDISRILHFTLLF